MTKKILIAEDDKDILISLAMALEWQGYEVVTARNGDLAQDLLTLMCRAKKKPDLLICDIHLPVLDGEEFIANIREMDIDLPIIVIAGDCNCDLQKRLIKLGCAAVFEKPFAHNMLLDKIKFLFDQEKT